jgi:hypothetical protein
MLSLSISGYFSADGGGRREEDSNPFP